MSVLARTAPTKQAPATFYATVSTPEKPHIADIDFASFYRPAFPSLAETQSFFEVLENLPASKTKAKIVLYQAARMLWLADRIEEVAAGRAALQILFYLIAAELVAKLVFDFDGEGESRKHVRRFFQEICSDEHRRVLSKAFLAIGRGYLSHQEAVDVLYRVRCDVVHEGQYYLFHLRYRGDRTPMLAGAEHPTVSEMTIDEFRQIVLEGAVLGCRRILSL